jgi:hypothetical protein
MSRLDFEVDDILRIARTSHMEETFVRNLIKLKLESLLKNGFSSGFCFCAEHVDQSGKDIVKSYPEALNDFLNNY